MTKWYKFGGNWEKRKVDCGRTEEKGKKTGRGGSALLLIYLASSIVIALNNPHARSTFLLFSPVAGRFFAVGL